MKIYFDTVLNLTFPNCANLSSNGNKNFWLTAPGTRIKQEFQRLKIDYDSLDNLNKTNMCTGYMLIKTNPKMIKLYDCVSEIGKKKYMDCAMDNNDQTYFNTFVKPFCTYKALPLEKYPNGKMFYENSAQLKDSEVLVHFNWVQGHLKMAKMKEHKMWLLTAEEEEQI
jgi:hypothetical protein